MNYIIRWIGFTANRTHGPVSQGNSSNYYQSEAKSFNTYYIRYLYLTHRYTRLYKF